MELDIKTVTGGRWMSILMSWGRMVPISAC